MAQVLADFIPNSKDRRTKYKTWEASKIPATLFLPKIKLAPKSPDPNAPPLMCQVTTFACGSTAISIAFTHALADAQTLAFFAQSWASTHRAILKQESLPDLNPIFAPQLLDEAAAGSSDGFEPDLQILKKARSLPCHRYDYFATVDGPAWAIKTVPPEVDAALVTSPGTSMNWKEWDLTLPCMHYLLHFSRDELMGMWEASNSAQLPVSKHDALLAHLWMLITRARFKNPSEHDFVHLDVSIGLRSRLDPPLPHSFLGSPMMIANISSSASALTGDVSPGLAFKYAANRIRSTLSMFDDGAVRALLHDAAHEICAQRLWQAFLGRNHVILTSWVQIKMYDVNFGIGDCRYVDAIMASMDGIVEIMESKPMSGVLAFAERPHWSDHGVDVSVHLEAKTLQRLLCDPFLRRFEI